MSRVLYHMAHDPVGNSESVLTEYDAELIARASEKGIVFVAVDEDGGAPSFRRKTLPNRFLKISP